MIARRIMDEILDSIQYSCCNPYVSAGKKFYSRESFQENEAEVREECARLNVEYEESLLQVWWAQPVKSDPSTNISNNRVPPTEELRAAEHGGGHLLWIGTSISNQSIDTEEVGRRTNMVIRKKKIFTYIGDGKIEPHLNFQDACQQDIKSKDKLIFIELGVNDVTNSPRVDPKAMLKEKVDLFCQLVLSHVLPGREIVIIKPIQRLDSREKEILSKWLGEELGRVFEGKTGVRVEDIYIRAKNTWERKALFGDKDGIHLAGPKGAEFATNQAVNLVRRVLRHPLPGPAAPWWSHQAEARSQSDIDEVLIIFFYFSHKSFTSGWPDLVDGDHLRSSRHLGQLWSPRPLFSLSK